MFHREEDNPFKYYDPRGLGCYKNLHVPTGLCIPTTDDGAWEHFSEHRWVYNKLEVALSQNLKCAPGWCRTKRISSIYKTNYESLRRWIEQQFDFKP